MDVVKRFDVHLVNLDPTVGHEIQKSRPCVIISPDEMNRHLQTVIIAPLTTTVRSYPTRVVCRFQRKQGQVALDQIRTVDRQRLIRRLGKLDATTATAISAVLLEMFTL
ncbi:type II toxin-antitoxin system PemK/MazF family toxin [bacterium]|nr:type II toxin-antitoxin system PemK/MazF family toxin [bacterium]